LPEEGSVAFSSRLDIRSELQEVREELIKQDRWNSGAITVGASSKTVLLEAHWRPRADCSRCFVTRFFVGQDHGPSLSPERGMGQVTRSQIDLPPGTQLSPTDSIEGVPSRREIALSPKGDLLVFSASANAEPRERRLYQRPLAGDRTEPITGTEGARQPFFSPDGQWIGFWSGGKLKKIRIGGGIAIVLGDLPATAPVGAFGRYDGRIILGNQRGSIGYLQTARA
jgi:hypothetical protein